MSTHAIIAAEFNSGIRGVYLHNDNDGPEIRLAVLDRLIANHGATLVRETLCGLPNGWSEIGTQPWQQELGNGKQDGRFAVVPGYGIRYTDDEDGGFWTPDQPLCCRDASTVFIIRKDGTVEVRESDGLCPECDPGDDDGCACPECTVPAMNPRDAITGAEVRAARDGHHIQILDDGIAVIYLTPSAALLLAAQLTESVTPADAINLIDPRQSESPG